MLAERRRQRAAAYQLARRRLLKNRLLVLDDFCLAKPDKDEVQSLFDIMNDRSGRHSTLVLSQKDHN